MIEFPAFGQSITDMEVNQVSVDVIPSSSSSSSPSTRHNTANILKGVVAFVDCRSGGEDRSDAIANQLELLGAVVERRFNKKVTHVIFNAGKQSTYDRAKRLGIPMVSLIWIESCKEAGGRKSENLFPARIDDCYENPLTKPKSFRCARWWNIEMSHEMDAARMKRNRRRREQREYRRRLLDPNYVSVENVMDVDKLLKAPPRVGPTLVFYESSSDEEEKDDIVPPPLTHRLLQKYPDSPILLEAYQRRERLRAEATGAVASDKRGFGENSEMPPTPTITQTETPKFESNSFETPNPSIKLNSKRTPKRLRAQAFSQSESEAEDKFRKLQIGGGDDDDNDDVVPFSRGSIEEFKVARKPTSKVRRFLSPSTAAHRSNGRRMMAKKEELVLTSFECSERESLMDIIKQLGRFKVKSTVSDRTSHVICFNHRRTLSVLHGSVRGCWLLSPEWVLKSFQAGKWIDEEPYELFEHFPTAQIYRLQRMTVAPFKCNIFAEVGPIYVGKGTNISQKDLRKLLILAGAQVVENDSRANVVIGSSVNDGKRNNVAVSYVWVMDSIMKNEVLPVDERRNEPENI